MKRTITKRTRPSFVGLFSGCGGFDLGFVQAGFHCVAAFDYDAEAVATHRKNLGGNVYCLDVTQNSDQVVTAVSQADVLVAGPPCQGFSTIGKRALNDPRNSLLLFVADVASVAKPKVVVVENVAGVLSPPHDRYWRQLESRLRRAGYTCKTIRFAASDFGVPQTRVRVMLIGTLSGAELHIPLHGGAAPTLRDILHGAESFSNHHPSVLQPGSAALEIAKRIGQGQKLCNVRGGERSVHTWHIPEVFGHVSDVEREVLQTLMRLRRQLRVRTFGDADPVSAEALSEALNRPCKRHLNSLVRKNFVRRVGDLYDLTNSFNGKYRRLSWTDLAPTVDTRFGQPRFFLHPEHHRGFSVREAARIQGFPDDFEFEGSVESQFRMVGNAVPPPLAASVARSIRDSEF
ncbi:DNA cytosine methyltransferase [Paraburkholderia sp. DD10]|uniref:DNA cytosine methyltransferase n=1 Tax=Paraburkholderia sp. DD10 TaxID=3409691 RepID=UPI003BA023CB